MGFRSLAQEVAFALSRASDWKSRVSLLAGTARFHAGNKLYEKAPQAHPIDVNIRFGDKPLSVRLRPHTGDLFIFYEVLAFNAYTLPEEFLAADDVRTIVDCGANVGITSLFLSQRYPKARILAVEPEPQNFALLKRNTSGVDRVVPIQAAITGSPQMSVRFSTDRLAWGNKVLDSTASGEHVEVPAVTIESLIDTYGLDRIDLLKVDIEGSEAELFKKPAFLSKVGTIMIELHGDYTLDRFRAEIAGMGFRADPPGTYPNVTVVTAQRGK